MTTQEKRNAIISKMITLEYQQPALFRAAYKAGDQNYRFLQNELDKLNN